MSHARHSPWPRRSCASGESSRARDILREAAGLAERLGAIRRLRDLAEEALGAGGARRPATRTGAASLTDSERRIAELAVGGRTNAEIADLLHLARRTVETHLTHCYRKLGIHRRSALSAALRRATLRADLWSAAPADRLISEALPLRGLPP